MQIDLGTLVVIVALAAASPLIVDVVPRIVLPVVVVEILLGIVVGPPILGWIHVTGLAQVLADFGLAFLFFLAGFPLVVAVTSLGVKDGQMRANTAAGLVGAAMVSVMVFPLWANAIRRRAGGAPNPS
jgi:Kef-type K+ transport system membrane component KefB